MDKESRRADHDPCGPASGSGQRPTGHRADVVVADRAVVEHERGTARLAAGDLAATLAPVAGRPTICVGRARHGDLEMIRRTGDPRVNAFVGDADYAVRYVELPNDVANGYERVNDWLWRIQHHLTLPARFSQTAFQQWMQAQRRFSEAALAEISDTRQPAVWIRGYEMMWLAHLIKAERHDARVGLFIDTPWQADAWRGLPREIWGTLWQGLGSAKVVGFNTRRWELGFKRCAEEQGLDVDGDRVGTTLVRTYPLGVDAARERRQADAARHLIPDLPIASGGKLIVGVDCSDPIKQIPIRILAFGNCLRDPAIVEYAPQLVLQVIPSGQNRPEYREELARIRGAATSVNRDHPALGYKPVVLLESDQQELALALYLIADAALVTSRYEGMHLGALRFSAVNERHGSLVLSTNTGASEVLGKYAIEFGPSRPDDLIWAIKQAIRISLAERTKNAAARREIVDRFDPVAWRDAQIADILAARP